MSLLFENCAVLDVEAGALRSADPAAHLAVVAKGGAFVVNRLA